MWVWHYAGNMAKVESLGDAQVVLNGASLEPSFFRWLYIALQLPQRLLQAICGRRPAS